MKRFLSPLAASFLAATAFLAVGHAEVSPVRVQVESTNKSDKDKTSTTQARVLNIAVTNSSAEPLELKVKFAVFGRDVKSKDIVTVDQGELPVSVKPRTTEKVQSPAAKASVDEPKAEKGKPKVDPTGNKIVGHGVQVLKGETVVAEFFEPASMKASFGTASPIAKPAAAKK